MNDLPSGSMHWEKVKSIFSDACELPSDERFDFVLSVSGDDVELRAEILSLLESHSDDDDPIERNVIDLATLLDKDTTDYADKRFGKYRIIRELGSGGMGAVFLAERDDGEFKMQVALKLIKRTIADSQTLLRFKQERQILANLHHPNIAALIDGGVGDNGEPFIVMEYVEGMPLIEHCDAAGLGLDDRLSMFLKICSAVSYAHRNLIIHRDIKPSNIIVTPEGEPKLLDFGMAKFFDPDASTTQTAFRAFTPAYASPEQIVGKQVTTATDQYSLGIVLYELLTGVKPFDVEGKTIDEIIRDARTTDAINPSDAVVSLRSAANKNFRIPRDLDTITLRSIRHEPERRYSSVDGFADDINRYLNGLPVAARPTTFGYLATRFIERNKAAAAATLLVLLAITVGAVAAIWQASIASRERDRAERRFNEVRQLSNSILFDVAPKLERLPGSIEARELLVVNALKYLDGLASETKNDRDLNSEIALAYEKVGDLQGNVNQPNLGDFTGAITSYEKSLSLFEQTGDRPDDIARVLLRLSRTRFAQNQMESAIADAERAVSILATTASIAPSDAAANVRLQEARLEMAKIYGISHRYEEAIPIFRDVLAKLPEIIETDREVGRLRLFATAYLSNSLSWNGEQAEAESENARAIQIAETLERLYRDDARVMQTVFAAYTLASSTHETIKNDVSLNFARKAFDVAKQLYEADPADSQARHNAARARSRRGVLLVLVRRVDDGIADLRQAEIELNALIAREPRNRFYLDDLGSLYTRMGDAEENRNLLIAALREYKRSAEIYQRLADEDTQNLYARRHLAQALKSVAVTEIKVGQKQEARSNLLKAIAIVEDLKQRNALGKWDVKVFDQMHGVLASINN